MSRRYFGTDGIRGAVGAEPITVDFVLKLGYAAGRVLAAQRSSGRPRVVIGKDTRVSGYLFESALEAGLLAAGCDVQLLGPMPTPGVAHLTQALRADAGIVVSASHNPYSDNGIKFFDQAGRKLDDAVELAIEAALAEPLITLASERLGRAERVPEAHGRYIEFCTAAFPTDLDLRGLKLVLDCAHGATYRTAPRVFAELGAEIRAIGVQPDGFNINDGVGSTHPQALVAAVAEHRADLGIAFDGDGDRVLMVDRQGQVRDGDELLYLLACDWHARGALRGPVVGTLMTNGALERALAQRGIRLVRAKVGDRYVLEQLLAHDANLGGEASGHLLLLDASNTGDAVVAALHVLAVLRRLGTDLATALAGLDKWPQVLVNVRTASRPALDDPRISAAVEAAQHELAGAGRLVLRPSGTEPLVRVMVEAESDALARRWAEHVADAVRVALPAG